MLGLVKQTIKKQVVQDGKIIGVEQCLHIHQGLGITLLINILREIYLNDQKQQFQLLCFATVQKDKMLIVSYQICDNILRGVLQSGRFKYAPFFFEPIHLKQSRILAIYPRKLSIKQAIQSISNSTILKTNKYQNKFVQVPSVLMATNIPHPLSSKKSVKNQPLQRKSSKFQRKNQIVQNPLRNKQQNKVVFNNQKNIKQIIQWAYQDTTHQTDQSQQIFKLMNNQKFKQVPMTIQPPYKIQNQKKYSQNDQYHQTSVFAKIQIAQKAVAQNKSNFEHKLLKITQKENKLPLKVPNLQKKLSLKDWLSYK